MVHGKLWLFINEQRFKMYRGQFLDHNYVYVLFHDVRTFIIAKERQYNYYRPCRSYHQNYPTYQPISFFLTKDKQEIWNLFFYQHNN